MATLAGLRSTLRLTMSDLTYAFSAQDLGDGSTTRFDLPVDNVVTDAEFTVKVAGTTLATPADYVLDAGHGIVVLTAAPADGAAVEVTGYHTEVFTNTQLDQFLNIALDLHGHNRSPALTFATLPKVEEYPLVLLAKVEALWVLATDASYDIDIRTVEGVSVPRSQRFAQIMTLINGVKQRYDELAQALNVGPSRMEQMTLRRISRTTNRLVPVYLPREVDDTRPPERVFPPIDAQGVPQATPTIGVYQIQVTLGESFSRTFTFNDADGNPRDLTGYTFDAQVYMTKFSSVTAVEFDIDTSDVANGRVTLSLTKEQTTISRVNSNDPTNRLEPARSYVWRGVLTAPDGTPDEVLQGPVVTEDPYPHSVLEVGNP